MSFPRTAVALFISLIWLSIFLLASFPEGILSEPWNTPDKGLAHLQNQQGLLLFCIFADVILGTLWNYFHDDDPMIFSKLNFWSSIIIAVLSFLGMASVFFMYRLFDTRTVEYWQLIWFAFIGGYALLKYFDYMVPDHHQPGYIRKRDGAELS